MFNKQVLGALAFCMAGFAAHAAYPEREINGVIQWGAGGATDVVARAVTPHAEAVLGKKIVLVNRAGGAGAIATASVFNGPSDGYTLLYGAENPQVHGVLGVGELDYSKFYPVNILGRGVVVIVARPDTPWKSVKDLVADAQKAPGKIKMGSTGPGGLPYNVGALLGSVTQLKVNAVPFEGEGPGLTALQGGHVDFMPAGYGAASEHIKAGRLKALGVLTLEPFAPLPNVPTIVSEFPEFRKYLPWGPFYGVFVKRDAPEDVKATLTKAFRTAADNPQFRQLMESRGNVLMNISGAEADAFLKRWQQVTTWTLHEAGGTKKSPETLNIAKP